MKLNSLFFALFVFLFVNTELFAQVIKRMEPLNWWEGMNHSRVQIMLYGPKIAALTIKAEGLTVIEQIRTENPNYVFLTVETKGQKAGKYPLSLLNAKGKVVEKRDFELKVRNVGSALRKSYDASDVVYLLMPDRFANGDANNDSHPSTKEKADRNISGGRHGGEIGRAHV